MIIRLPRKVGTVACVLAMAAGTAGAIAIVGEPSADAATVTATQRVVVRPVTTTGHVAKGFYVIRESRSVRCTSTSPVAVDKDIAFCGSTADYTQACWRSATPHRVLCLSNPRSKRLESIKLVGTFPRVKAPRRPHPQAMRLVNGKRYAAVAGGAFARLRQHPSWLAYYFGGTHDTQIVYGPAGTGGVNTSRPVWIVTSYTGPKATGVRQKVATAYFVGNAG